MNFVLTHVAKILSKIEEATDPERADVGKRVREGKEGVQNVITHQQGTNIGG